MNTARFHQILVACMILIFLAGNAWASDQEYWDAARKASCPELIEAYKTTSAAERKVVAAMKSSKDGTVAANTIGVASFAILGIGFFTWDNDHSAEENLADLRNDLKIITTVSAEKKCALPAT